MKVWLSAAEIAALKMPGLPGTARGIQLLAIARGWDTSDQARPRVGAGGGLEFHIDALPTEARAEYVGRELGVEQELSRLARAPEPTSGGRATAARDARLAILSLAARFASQVTLSRKRADRLFCEELNAGRLTLAGWIVAEVKSLTPRTLQRWRRAVEDGRSGDLAVDRARRRGVLDLANDGEVKTYILAVIAKQPQLTAHHVRALVADRFGELTLPGAQPLRSPPPCGEGSGVGVVPHHATATPLPIPPPQGGREEIVARTVPIPPIRTFQHALKGLRKTYRNEILAIRNPDAYKGAVRFAARVAQPASAVNEIWQIDASPADVLCVDGRHAIYACVDIYSRRMIATVSKTPRAAAVALLVRKAILAWGVPETIKSDNGSDFIAHDTQRLLAALGIEHVQAPPFSPEKKGHVERAIGTLQRGLMRTLPGFIGHSVADRKAIESRKTFAARLGESDADMFEVTLTAGELQRHVDQWCETVYGHAAHAGLGGKTPFAVAASCAAAVRRISDVRALDMLLAPVAGNGLRTITKTGLRIDGAHYIGGFLNVGDQVLVRMDLADMGRAYVFSPDGAEFLGEAMCAELSGIDPAKAIAAARAEQKRLIEERMGDAKREARRIRPADFADAIHRQALKDAGTLIEFPKATEAHLTPALDAARRAADRDEQAAHAPEIAALAAMLLAEQAAPAPSNVRPLRSEETMWQRWNRARALEAALARNEEISADELLWLGGYREGPEYRGFKATYGDAGASAGTI